MIKAFRSCAPVLLRAYFPKYRQIADCILVPDLTVMTVIILNPCSLCIIELKFFIPTIILSVKLCCVAVLPFLHFNNTVINTHSKETMTPKPHKHAQHSVAPVTIVLISAYAESLSQFIIILFSSNPPGLWVRHYTDSCHFWGAAYLQIPNCTCGRTDCRNERGDILRVRRSTEHNIRGSLLLCMLRILTNLNTWWKV